MLVIPDDDKDRGWFLRYVADPIAGLVGEENPLFPEKWNLACEYSFVHIPFLCF